MFFNVRTAVLGFNIKLSISNGFGSALEKFETFCRFHALNSNPSRTSDNKDSTKRAVAKFQCNRFRHLFWFFLSRWCQWGHFKAKKPQGNLVNFHESRARTDGDRNILIEPREKKSTIRSPEKNPTYSLTVGYVNSYNFQVLKKKKLMAKVKSNDLYDNKAGGLATKRLIDRSLFFNAQSTAKVISGLAAKR